MNSNETNMEEILEKCHAQTLCSVHKQIKNENINLLLIYSLSSNLFIQFFISFQQ